MSEIEVINEDEGFAFEATNQDDIFLECFQMQNPAPKLIPARAKRQWMEDTGDRFAYRCLPLTMANASGWELLCPFDIDVHWDGGAGVEAITITSPDKDAYLNGFAVSHFSSGIVTFHTGYLFQTPPGWAVWCMGPPNEPKDGVYALSGLVETDWLPFPFTMNWKMTSPGSVRFSKGECFCFVTLMQHHSLDRVQPIKKTLEDDDDLKDDFMLWQNSRADFNKKLAAKDPETVASGWQRHYMQGQTQGQTQGEGESQADHMTKRRLRPLKDGSNPT